MVQKDGNTIYRIIKSGAIPSERVQLAAVNQNYHAINFIENPSEDVQLAAINKTPHALAYIIRKGPSKNGTLSEKVQLTAVKKNPDVIKYLINAGIPLSDEVKAAAGRYFEHHLHAKLMNQSNISRT